MDCYINDAHNFSVKKKKKERKELEDSMPVLVRAWDYVSVNL